MKANNKLRPWIREDWGIALSHPLLPSTMQMSEEVYGDKLDF